jgi:hypothetical protein
VSHEDRPGEPSLEGSRDPGAKGNGGDQIRVARLLAVALKAARLYPAGHARVVSACGDIAEACRTAFEAHGPFGVETRSGHIVDESGTVLSADIGVAALAKDMRAHGIRAIRFAPDLDEQGVEGLVTLLREPPLELAGRGGAEQAARTLRGISLLPYEYSFDGTEADDVTPRHDPAWDLSDLKGSKSAAAAPAPERTASIPEVQEALDELKRMLADVTLDGDRSEQTVGTLLKLVEERIASVQALGAETTAPLPGQDILKELGEGPHTRAGERIAAVADRVYGLILAHATLEPGEDAGGWVASEDGATLVPVDPEEVPRICTALSLLPEGPSTLIDTSSHGKFQAILATMFANLVPECTLEGNRMAVLLRLCRAYDRAAAGDEKRDALASVADLLLTVDLEPAVLEHTLQELRKGVPSAELSRMLVERLPRCSNLRIRQLARELDAEAVRGIFDAYLTQKESSRAAALNLLKSVPDLVQSHLESYSRHPDIGRRLRVVEAAQEMEGSGATAVLQTLAGDEADRIRIAALKALSDRTDDTSVLIFETALDASPPRVWAAIAQMLSGTGDLRVPRVLENIVRGFGEKKRPLRERLLALQTLARIPGASGRHRISELTRYQNMREPVAALRIRNEAKRLLKSAPGLGSIGDII